MTIEANINVTATVRSAAACRRPGRGDADSAVAQCGCRWAPVASVDVAQHAEVARSGFASSAKPLPAILRSCDEAEAYVASVCFKHGPPRLLGVELEWLLHRPENPTAPSDPGALTAALGPHAPHSLDSSSPARLLSQGSAVTVEPGGQVELASTPRIELGHLLRTVRADAHELHNRLAAAGLYPHPRAADPVRPPRRVLDLPRYRAMEEAFDRIGPHGRSGMCTTAAVQVCLDAGERAGDRPPLAGAARARAGAARRVRQLAAAARREHRVGVQPDGLLAVLRPGPHVAAERLRRRPGRRLGGQGARARRCCACARTARAGRPRPG